MHWPQVGALGACARDDRCAHRQPETSASAPLAGACLPGTRDTHATHRHLGNRHPRLSASKRTFRPASARILGARSPERGSRPLACRVMMHLYNEDTMYPLGLFAASFSDHLRQLCSSSTVNDPKPNVERRHLAFLLGTIHETLNSLSDALSPLAQRRNKNSCLPVLSRLTLSQWSVAVGCARRHCMYHAHGHGS